jgi:hypothetical protein
MSEDIVRVLRIYEFVGPRSQVEQQVARSLHGTKYVRDWRQGSEIVIRAVTVPGYPEILSAPPEQPVTAETAEPVGEVPDIAGPEVDDDKPPQRRGDLWGDRDDVTTELLTALKGLYGLIGRYELISNTMGDSQLDYLQRMVAFVKTIKEAEAAITRAEGRGV